MNGSPNPRIDTTTATRPGPVCERLASRCSAWTGSTPAFMAALVITLAWLVTGPVFNYSDTWQLIINSITSVVTFLMVFLIQRSQNRDLLSLKIQISELIAAMDRASNSIIDLDSLSEQQLDDLHRRYLAMSHAQPGCEGLAAGPARTQPPVPIEGPREANPVVQDAAKSLIRDAGCTPDHASKP